MRSIGHVICIFGQPAAEDSMTTKKTPSQEKQPEQGPRDPMSELAAEWNADAPDQEMLALNDEIVFPLEEMGRKVRCDESGEERRWYVNDFCLGDDQQFRETALEWYIHGTRSYTCTEIADRATGFAAWAAENYVVPPTEHLDIYTGPYKLGDPDPYESDLNALIEVAARTQWIKTAALAMGFGMTIFAAGAFGGLAIAGAGAVDLGLAGLGLGLRLAGHGMAASGAFTFTLTRGELDAEQEVWFKYTVLANRSVLMRYLNEQCSDMPHDARMMVKELVDLAVDGT